MKIKLIAFMFLFLACGNPELNGLNESPDFDSSNSGQILEILNDEEKTSASICDLADSFIEGCTGLRPSRSTSCSEEESYAAQAIIDSGCDTILEQNSDNYSLRSVERESSEDQTALCGRYGIACERKLSCNTALNSFDRSELIQLSDTSKIRTMADVARNLNAVKEIFVRNQDARGIFSVVYAPITERALKSVNDGEYSDQAWAERLMVDFANRYFDNLRAYLIGGKLSREWKRYYHLAENCRVSRLRVAAAGVSVHLLVDLPFSLRDSGTRNKHYEDYMNFGDILVAVTPTIIKNLDKAYGVDAKDFFNGFFLGKWADSLAGKPITTSFMFQTIRGKAWRNSRLLGNWFSSLIARGEIFASWHTADGLIQILDGANII